MTTNDSVLIAKITAAQNIVQAFALNDCGNVVTEVFEAARDFLVEQFKAELPAVVA